MGAEEKKTKSFNIYYLNFSKVYEISMMINNVILKSIQKEKGITNRKGFKFKSALSGSSKEYLSEVKSYFSSEIGREKIISSNVVESLDIKTTKSILLQRIIEKSKETNNLKSRSEGDLIKVKKVNLKILDEENLRQILMLRKDALKGFRVEGMDVNNLVGSLLQDYSYVLYGKIDDDQDIIIKIPMEIEDDFENKYNVDDLLVGHVSVIGIYKGLVTKDHIMSNTFNYLSKVGILDDHNTQNDSKMITSNKQRHQKTLSNSSEVNKSGKSYHYIDVISIIQDIGFEHEETKKVSLFQKIKGFFSKRG